MINTLLRVGILCGAVLCGSAMPGQASDPNVEYLGTFVWPSSQHNLGGFSGLEVSQDGATFTTISDRGTILSGRFLRKNGLIEGVETGAPSALRDTDGTLMPGWKADSEGLAVRSDGRIYVSFEGIHRVWVYLTLNAGAQLPRDQAFRDMPGNSGFEALAVDDKNRLYAIPERSGRLTRPFPIWRYDGKLWKQVFRISRDGGFQPVGADFGPDGKLYVLERAFPGLGFKSRIRRFTLSDSKITQQETLLETPTRQHDNLEGIAVWQDDKQRLRITMISDDNFRPFLQNTEFVEYVIKN